MRTLRARDGRATVFRVVGPLFRSAWRQHTLGRGYMFSCKRRYDFSPVARSSFAGIHIHAFSLGSLRINYADETG